MPVTNGQGALYFACSDIFIFKWKVAASTQKAFTLKSFSRAKMGS